MIKEAKSDDSFVTSLVDALPEETIYSGVYTEEDLKTRFDKVCDLVAEVALNICSRGLLFYQIIDAIFEHEIGKEVAV